MLQLLKRFKQSVFLKAFPLQVKHSFFNQIAQLNWTNIKDKNIENELLLIQLFLKQNPEGVFIDVGANLGQYLYQAEQCISKENIIGFEPHPQLNHRLKQLFKGCQIYEAALSDHQGTAQFKIPYFDSREIHTRGTLKTEHTELEETNAKLIEVDIDTIDHFTTSTGIQNVSVIKIDVEGAEFDVVKGAINTIQKNQPILIIEIEQRHHQIDIKEQIKSIEQMGNYLCLYFDALSQTLKQDVHSRSILELQSPENHAKNRQFINNFIFVPKQMLESGQIAAWQQAIHTR